MKVETVTPPVEPVLVLTLSKDEAIGLYWAIDAYSVEGQRRKDAQAVEIALNNTLSTMGVKDL